MTDRERSCAECGKSGGWALYCVACMEKLVQPEQAPVAWMFEDDEDNGHKTFRQTPPSPEAVAYLAKWNRPAWAPLYTAPPQRKPPQFPTMLRKMWSGAEVQKWINENWEQS